MIFKVAIAIMAKEEKSEGKSKEEKIIKYCSETVKPNDKGKINIID